MTELKAIVRGHNLRAAKNFYERIEACVRVDTTESDSVYGRGV